jgi:hypothetical protein
MKNQSEYIQKEEKKKIEEWLQKQSWFVQADSASEGLAMVLYKLFTIETQLERIQYHQQTHWVR